MEVNKEYESLAKFTADLSNLLQHNVVSVSGRLLEKGLVTKDVYDSMLTTEGVSGQKNAARLMSCVLDRVKCSSRCFHDFISVLREDTYFKDIVVKILEDLSKASFYGRGINCFVGTVVSSLVPRPFFEGRRRKGLIHTDCARASLSVNFP